MHPTRQSLSPQTPLLQLAPAGGSGRLLQVAGRGMSLWQLAEAGQGGESGEPHGVIAHGIAAVHCRSRKQACYHLGATTLW